MNIKVKLFGELADIAGRDELTLNDVQDVQSLRSKFSEAFPATSGKQFLIALNRKVVHHNPALNAADEVAFMPPFSGG